MSAGGCRVPGCLCDRFRPIPEIDFRGHAERGGHRTADQCRIARGLAGASKAMSTTP